MYSFYWIFTQKMTRSAERVFSTKTRNKNREREVICLRALKGKQADIVTKIISVRRLWMRRIAVKISEHHVFRKACICQFYRCVPLLTPQQIPILPRCSVCMRVLVRETTSDSYSLKGGSLTSAVGMSTRNNQRFFARLYILPQLSHLPLHIHMYCT